MNADRKRWLLRLAVVPVLGLIGLLWFLNQRSRELTVENRAGRPIAELKVTLAGRARAFENIPDGSAVHVTAGLREDDRFNLEGRLADDDPKKGVRIRFVGKVGERLHLIVLPGGGVQPRPEKARW